MEYPYNNDNTERDDRQSGTNTAAAGGDACAMNGSSAAGGDSVAPPRSGIQEDNTHSSPADTAASAGSAAQDSGVYHYAAGDLTPEQRTQNTYRVPVEPSYRATDGSYGTRGYSTPYTGSAGGYHSAPQPPYNTQSRQPQQSYPLYGAANNTAGDGPVYSHMFSNGRTQKPKKQRGRVSGATVALCCLLSLLFGFGGSLLADIAMPEREVQIDGGVLYQSVDRDGTDDDGSATRATVVDMTKDSVVEITTETRTTNQFMFGNYVTQGAGSGVIITTDGYIVTNNHVVSGAGTITVIANGTEYPAALIGTDATTDLAVLKIEATGLAPAVFGSSESVRVGDSVIAIGNPLGSLGGSVTDGIISALEREIDVQGQRMTLLQTNADVNPGNSGGGLFNMDGELIGIVNAKSSAGTGETAIEGIGFAIPVDTVKEVAAAIMEGGYVRGRVVMGIQVIEVTTQQAATQYGVSRLGVYIVAVDEGLGAEAAGILAGDYIVSVEGQLVETSSDITSLLNDYNVGDTIEVQIIREGSLLTFEVELSEKKG